MGIFSNAQGQLTPQSMVESGRNSNSSEILWLSSFPASMKKIRSKMKVRIEDNANVNVVCPITRPMQGVQRRKVLLVKFCFRIFQKIVFWFVVAVIFGLIHDVEAMFHLA